MGKLTAGRLQHIRDAADLGHGLSRGATQELLDHIDTIEAELAATRRAKAENDERFMTERDAARAELASEKTARLKSDEDYVRVCDELARLRAPLAEDEGMHAAVLRAICNCPVHDCQEHTRKARAALRAVDEKRRA